MSHERIEFTLLQAALDLTSSLDLKSGLQNFVDQACALTSSPHATMCVLDTWGATTLRLEHHDSYPAPPVPESLPTVIPVNTPLLVNSPQDAPDIDLPTSTPPFLGVSVLVHEQVYGRLYLMGKPGGYTDEDAAVVAALAPAAGIAVENANLYADSKRTARWISASQSLTTTMLEGADEEEALELIAKTVREVSHADTAIIVLQSVGDTWAAEIVDGKNASNLLGSRFPARRARHERVARGHRHDRRLDVTRADDAPARTRRLRVRALCSPALPWCFLRRSHSPTPNRCA